MVILCLVLSMIALSAVIYSNAVVRKVKNQTAEMLEVLADIKNGNGNRRILAKPYEIIAPLAYEINNIVLNYENKLSVFRQAEKETKRLMTSLSHDVRTPLTTLIGYLDAVHKGGVTGQERDDYIEIARRKSHDLKEYIDVLFDWFKLNSDEFVMKMGPTEAAELTRNILIDWIPVFESRGLEYDVSIPEKPLWAKLDPDGYMRIINNLIQNVIAHSHGDQIKISLWEVENLLKIQVSDNGIGIKDEDLKHIFKRLYKCDRGRSEKGSGLGLSIAYQLAEKMNGKITAESKLEKGTVITLVFPAVRFPEMQD